ncbi:MAG TPA: APC family permease [Methanoregulaceae archaeon]|nr:APC family permease [Methanoregulaceae archaeon]
MSGSVRSRGLGLFAAIAFAVGNMVGAGVFVLSGLVIQTAGPSAVFSYLFCGIIVAFSGLSYAALASIYPEDGGGYLYAKRMLGPFPGFLAGWAMYISLSIASAFVLLGFGIYTNLLIGTSYDPRIFAIVGVVFLTGLNLRGLSEAGKVEIALVVSKVAILLAFIMAGLFYVSRTDFQPFFPAGAGGMLEGMTMVFFAYLGFQVVALMAGEVKEASRNVPLATLGAIVIVAFIYTGVIIAILSASLPSYGSNSVFDAAVVLFGSFGGIVVSLGAVFSTLSAANANILGGSRIILEMATEKQIPGNIARLYYNQPIYPVLFGSAIAVALIAIGNLDFVVNLTNVTTLATMTLVNLSALLLVLREHRIPPEKSYFRLPLGYFIPIAGAVSCIAMLLTLSPHILFLGFTMLFAGLGVYLIEDTPEGVEIREKIRGILGRAGK